MKRFLIGFALLFPVLAASADQKCREFVVNEAVADIPARYSDAVLWKVSRNGQRHSYIFGTIHVSDPRVVDLPGPVVNALDESETFTMEAIPEPDDLLILRELMFFPGETRLNHLLEADKYSRAAEILKKYNLSGESITRLKPWAAYLTMNYPVNDGLPLDLVLLQMARERGMKIAGLETLSEQLSALTGLGNEQQIRILVDTLCNYDQVLRGFEDMIALYLDRDVRGLYAFSMKYSLQDDDIYDHLYRKLLIDRNYLMVDRLDEDLQTGGVFVAIGALHLAGEEGVLALLDDRGYKIEAVY